MEFWYGMILGIFIGANTGVLIAGLCKSCRRGVEQAAGLAGWHPMDEAVMEEALAPAAKTPQPVISAAPQPFPHLGH
jgi:hypothetical protein